MDRYAIFVDSGYVYAAGGTLILDTPNRSQIRLDHERFIAQLRAIVEGEFPDSGSFLRVYWYDAAPRGVAQLEHERIAQLAGLKVRLGRQTRWGQKGVDALVLRDMMRLSAEHAICTAFLFAGDEDLRQGVIEAQDYGVKVAVFGIQPTIDQNQAASLIHEADDQRVLSFAELQDCFTRTIGDRGAVWLDEGFDAHAIGYGLGQVWACTVPTAEAATLSAPTSFLPRDLDAELIRRLLELGDLPASVQLPDFVIGQARDGLRAAARDATALAEEVKLSPPVPTASKAEMPAPPVAGSQSPPAPPEVTTTAPETLPEDQIWAFAEGASYGRKWLSEQPEEEVRYVRGLFPRLPPEIDLALLKHLVREMDLPYGSRVDDEDKKAARAGFWQPLGMELETGRPRIRAKQYEPITESDPFRYGRAFAAQWAERSEAADIQAARQLLEKRVGLPSGVDGVLLRLASATFGDPVPVDIRHRLRDGFKDGIENP